MDTRMAEAAVIGAARPVQNVRAEDAALVMRLVGRGRKLIGREGSYLPIKQYRTATLLSLGAYRVG
jgi:hypothetical protein